MKEKKGNWIYIGPSVPPVGLKQNTLYRSAEPPEPLMNFVRIKPSIRALYVSTKELARAQIALAKRGSVEQIAQEELRTLAKALPR